MRHPRLLLAMVFSNALVMPALAAPPCLQAGEAQAFNIIGLKSTLMVEALSCGLDRKYDGFMARFQPQVLDAQHLMDDYFVRQGGLSGQAMEDRFVTQLANGESDAAAQLGGAFCGNAAKQFNDVAALGGTMDLVSYAVAENLAAPPAGTVMCPAAPATPPLVVASAPPARRPQLPAHHDETRVATVHKPKPAPAVVPPYMVAQMM